MRVTVAQQAPVASANVTRARASVSVVVPVTQASSTLLAASTSTAIAQAAATVETLVAANSYILLTSSSVLDTSGLYMYTADLAVVSDASFRVVGKALTDTFGQTDYITGKTFALGKHDSVTLPDYIIRTLEYIRRFTESLSFTHRVAFTLSRPLTDSFAFSDTTTKGFTKIRAHSVGAIDTRPVFSVNKLQAHSVTALDASTRGFTKAAADSVNPVEARNFSLNRPLAESFVAADTARLSASKALTDSFTQTDAATRDFGKATTDLFTFSDTTTRVTGKTLQDSFNQSDANTRAVDKVLADAFAFTELLSRSVNRTIQDGFAMNDSADLADGITYQSVKYISNLAFATDAKVLSNSLAKADTVSLVSAGLLTSQSYCDLSYFAEDYVGLSRTFS